MPLLMYTEHSISRCLSSEALTLSILTVFMLRTGYLMCWAYYKLKNMGLLVQKSMLQFCICLHLWNTGSNIKLSRISSWQKQSIKQSVESFQAWTPARARVTCLFLTFMVHQDLLSLLLWLWPGQCIMILNLPWPFFVAICWLLFTQILWVAIQALVGFGHVPKVHKNSW